MPGHFFKGLSPSSAPAVSKVLFVIGRSLGSAPAIEVAYRYQQLLQGLIVESGFASQKRQFARLGVTHLFKDVESVVGFGNDAK